MDPYSFDVNSSFPDPPTFAGGGDLPSAPAPAAATKTLKKGSACLHCRKRKLRCSGERPICASCSKNRHECVYEDPSSRPKGRVRQLEDKIASLERYLTSGATNTPTPPAPPPPTSSFPYPSTRERRASNPPPMLSAQESFTLALEGLFKMEGIMEGADAGGFDPTQPAAFTFGAGGGLKETAYYPPEEQAQVNLQSWEFGLTDEQPVMAGDEMFIQGFSPPSNITTTTATGTSDGLPTPSTGYVPSGLTDRAFTYPTPWSDFDSKRQSAFQPEAKVGFVLPSEWNDQTVLSPDLRAHLLQLFFQRRRQFALVLHVARFFASLDGPPDAQPRAELLFAMYACAARFSPFQEVVDAEERFVDLAQRHIKLALRWHRAGKQTVQASSLLSLYFYSRGIYAEGWVQSGVTMRLLSTCGLNTIETGNFLDYPRADPRRQPQVRRVGVAPFTSLGPPADPIELGERIWAFWTAFYIDRGGSSSTGWPEAMADPEIQTPLPRPLEEYETDGFSVHAERFLSDLLSPDSPSPSRPDGVGSVLIQALTLHHRISRIGQHPTLKAAHRSSPTSSPASSSSDTTPEPARLPGPVPQILLDQELLLQKFVASMPPSASTLKGPGGIPPYNASRTLSTDQGSLDSAGTSTTTYGVHPIVFSLNTVLYTAFMVLYEEMAFFDGGAGEGGGAGGRGEEYELKATQAAVAAVSMVATIVEIDFGELDLLLVFFWKNIARFLLERAKTLRRRGLDEEAALREIDVDVLVLSMRRFGEVWTLGDSQALLLEKFQSVKLAEEGDGGEENLEGRV